MYKTVGQVGGPREKYVWCRIVSEATEKAEKERRASGFKSPLFPRRPSLLPRSPYSVTASDCDGGGFAGLLTSGYDWHSESEDGREGEEEEEEEEVEQAASAVASLPFHPARAAEIIKFPQVSSWRRRRKEGRKEERRIDDLAAYSGVTLCLVYCTALLRVGRGSILGEREQVSWRWSLWPLLFGKVGASNFLFLRELFLKVGVICALRGTPEVPERRTWR